MMCACRLSMPLDDVCMPLDDVCMPHPCRLPCSSCGMSCAAAARPRVADKVNGWTGLLPEGVGAHRWWRWPTRHEASLGGWSSHSAPVWWSARGQPVFTSSAGAAAAAAAVCACIAAHFMPAGYIHGGHGHGHGHGRGRGPHRRQYGTWLCRQQCLCSCPLACCSVPACATKTPPHQPRHCRQPRPTTWALPPPAPVHGVWDRPASQRIPRDLCALGWHILQVALYSGVFHATECS